MSKIESVLRTMPALTILESLPVGITISGEDGVVVWVNDTLCTQLGVTSSEIIGQTWRQFPVQKLPTTSPATERYFVPPKAGQPERWLESIPKKIACHDGTSLELCCVLDVTRSRQEKRLFSSTLDLIDSSRLDSVTGLLTKKAIIQELISQLTRSRRYRNPLSVLMLRVNPLEKGPSSLPLATALKAVGGVLKDKLRWVDSAGHW